MPYLKYVFVIFFLCIPLNSNSKTTDKNIYGNSGYINSGLDSLRQLVDSTVNNTDSVNINKIVKRKFNSTEQVAIGSFMMVFILIIITTVGNWNP